MRTILEAAAELGLKAPRTERDLAVLAYQCMCSGVAVNVQFEGFWQDAINQGAYIIHVEQRRGR